MNTEQLTGLVRTILSAIGGYFVGKGIIDASTMVTVSGALATVFVGVWSAWANRKAGLVQSVTNMTEVNSNQLQAAITDPTLKAAAVPAK